LKSNISRKNYLGKNYLLSQRENHLSTIQNLARQRGFNDQCTDFCFQLLSEKVRDKQFGNTAVELSSFLLFKTTKAENLKIFKIKTISAKQKQIKMFFELFEM
jgi:hypothetical protein